MAKFIGCLSLAGNSHQQRGIALLMAIMIVALVTIISINMLTKRQLQIYRTSNLLNKEQAVQYALAVERWGESVLLQDLQQQQKSRKFYDSYQNLWNTHLDKLKVEPAELEGHIMDLQGRFNLNNLLKKGKVQKKWVAIYKRLLSALNLPVELSDSLIDWLDANGNTTGSFGAEDVYYMKLDKPYRTANRPLRQVTELYLVKGYDKDIIAKLRPHIYIAEQVQKINVNTSTTDVLQAAIPDLSADQAGNIITLTQTEPFENIADFLKHLNTLKLAGDPDVLTFRSSYFVVTSRVKIAKIQTVLQSIIKRDKKNVQVLNRREYIWYKKPVQLSDKA